MKENTFALPQPGKSYSIIFGLLLISIIPTGCCYYKVSHFKGISAMEGEKLLTEYCVVHQGTNVWHLKDIGLNPVQQKLTGRIGVLSEDHQYYKNTKPMRSNRYKPRNGNPADEVHIYISEYIEGQDPLIIIPFSEIKEIEDYDKAKETTAFSYALFGILLSVIGFLVLYGLITGFYP
jgi:hypothetical protein